MPFPDLVNDPSLAMPHLTYQIQTGQAGARLAGPVHQGSFELPAVDVTEQSTKRTPLLRGARVWSSATAGSRRSTASFAVDSGEIVGIAGPNGAGKTTLFDVVTGIVRADAGTITFAGQSIHDAQCTEICQLGIARTFQHAVGFRHSDRGCQRPGRRPLRRAPAVVVRPSSQGPKHARDDPTRAGVRRAGRSVGRAGRAARGVRQEAADDRFGAGDANPHCCSSTSHSVGSTPLKSTSSWHCCVETRQRGVTIVVIEHVMRALMALSDRVLIMNHGKQVVRGLAR